MEDLLSTHRRLLERFRKSMNLVGPGDLDLHYADCAGALSVLEPAGTWADLGSGAGFPGIPFAARFPEVALDLVDSRQKRCVFLEHVLAEGRASGLAPVRVVCRRIEDLAPGYDGVLARALAPPPAVLAHAARLLRPGGRVLLMMQRDQPLPEDPRFEVLVEHPYRAGGKERRVVLARRRPPGPAGEARSG